MRSLSDAAIGKLLLSLKPFKALTERHEESTYLACDPYKEKTGKKTSYYKKRLIFSLSPVY